MKLSAFLRPSSLSEAHDALQELGERGMALAGGTALHFLKSDRPVTAVDITRLGLSYIRPEGDWYAIGATTPLSDIQRYRAPRWALHEICRRISTHQIRNASTIGGNVCRVFPWADLPVVLLAMDARLTLFDGHEETGIGADAFFEIQPAQRYFKDGALLTCVKVPVLHARQGFGSVKTVRTSAAFSLVTVAVRLELEDDYIRSVRVAAGSAIPFPRRLPSVEAALIGREACAAVFEEAAAKAEQDTPWRGREGMSIDGSKQLGRVAILDALERAVAFARERT